MLDFSRKYRLVNQIDFQFVFAKPLKISCQYMLVLCRPNQKPCARLGISIKKSLIYRAIDRNRLRRIIRESFRIRKEQLKGLDIIVVMQSKCTALYVNSKRRRLDWKQVGKIWRADVGNLWSKLIVTQQPVSSQ